MSFFKKTKVYTVDIMAGNIDGKYRVSRGSKEYSFIFGSVSVKRNYDYKHTVVVRAEVTNRSDADQCLVDLSNTDVTITVVTAGRSTGLKAKFGVIDSRTIILGVTDDILERLRETFTTYGIIYPIEKLTEPSEHDRLTLLLDHGTWFVTNDTPSTSAGNGIVA